MLCAAHHARSGEDTAGDKSSRPAEEAGNGGGEGNDAADNDEDDLYDDLYGGLNDEGADTDVVRHSTRGDGGGASGDGDAKGERDGIAAGGNGVEAGEGESMAKDVNTRAVMNALKVNQVEVEPGLLLSNQSKSFVIAFRRQGRGV